MTRFARRQPVVFFEEPDWTDGAEAGLVRRRCDASGVIVAVPSLPRGLSPDRQEALLRGLLDGLL